MNELEYFEEFKNGTLSGDKSSEMFQLLAEDSELRNSFQSYLFIANTMEKSIPSFAPSASQKANIFAKAGFDLPTPEPIVNNSNSVKTDSKFNRRELVKFVQGIAAGFILFASLALYFYPQTQNNTHSFANHNSKQSQIQSDNFTSQNNSTNIVSSKADDSKLSSMQSKQNSGLSLISKSNLFDNNKAIEDTSFRDNELDASIENRISRLEFSDSRLNSAQFGSISLPSNNLSFEQKYSPIAYSKDVETSLYRIEFKNAINLNSQNTTALPKQLSPMNNLNLTVFYKFYDDLELGLDIKQETFIATYTGIEADGKEYKYTQQPNFTNIGILARYSPINIENFKPFAQIGLGANKAGIIFKTGLGFQFPITHSLFFVTGLDYQLFNFKHNSQWFNSSKIGVHYGFTYQF